MISYYSSPCSVLRGVSREKSNLELNVVEGDYIVSLMLILVLFFFFFFGFPIFINIYLYFFFFVVLPLSYLLLCVVKLYVRVI